MLFMVIERTRPENIPAVGERFRARGRMLPDCIAYLASWLTPTGETCYQVMESPTRELLDQWTSRWADLTDFEVVPVLASADFWASRRS